MKKNDLINDYKLVLFITFFSLFQSFCFSQEEKDDSVTLGKKLFNTNCAACHKLNKKAVGPALRGVSDKYEKEWLYQWIKNSAVFIKSGDAKAVAIWEEYNKSPMTAFPQLSNEDIDNIIAYTDYVPPAAVVTNAEVAVTTTSSTNNWSQIIVIFTIIVFLFLSLLFYGVRKFLRRVALEKGIVVVEEKKKNLLLDIWQSYIKNQFLLLLTVIFLTLTTLYLGYAYLMQIGIDQGYMPVQPIHYSHKIHAGDNQIDCKFCHSSARVSKEAGIPSLNVCMNCHKYISEYNGEEDIENGYTKEFYTDEIKKLYKAVGWDEENQEYTGEIQAVEWIRIHNLPAFAYFPHVQHVEVAGIECQTCHGPVEEMEVMYQYAPLTMEWCIDCHRKTNVNLKDNEYYKKIHEELSKKYGVEKLTIAEMGGIECGKCHY